MGPLIVLLSVTVLVHVLRGARVTPRAVATWADQRGMRLDARLSEMVRRHLRRKHAARAGATLLVGAVSVTFALMSRPLISFFSLPVVLGVLVAQLLMPHARRGRIRSVVLAHRSSSYFAPRHPLRVARSLFLLAVAVSLTGALGQQAWRWALTEHALVLLVADAAMEATLLTLSRRGLPDRSDDMAVECALRVMDARAVVAAGLVASGTGLYFASLYLLRGLNLSVAAIANEAGTALVLTMIIWAITLTQPLRSWTPA